MLEQYEDIMDVNDLCEVFRVGRGRVYELLQTNQISGFRLGRNWRIPKLSVINYIESQINKPEKLKIYNHVDEVHE